MSRETQKKTRVTEDKTTMAYFYNNATLGWYQANFFACIISFNFHKCYNPCFTYEHK